MAVIKTPISSRYFLSNSMVKYLAFLDLPGLGSYGFPNSIQVKTNGSRKQGLNKDGADFVTFFHI